jgi:hypothetical protein
VIASSKLKSLHHVKTDKKRINTYTVIFQGADGKVLVDNAWVRGQFNKTFLLFTVHCSDRAGNAIANTKQILQGRQILKLKMSNNSISNKSSFYLFIYLFYISIFI